MPVIVIEKEVKNCNGCPFCVDTNHYSTDGWDQMEDWECTKMPADPNDEKHKKGKVIGRCIEWMDRTPIPEWCPILKKEENETKNT